MMWFKHERFMLPKKVEVDADLTLIVCRDISYARHLREAFNLPLDDFMFCAPAMALAGYRFEKIIVFNHQLDRLSRVEFDMYNRWCSEDLLTHLGPSGKIIHL